MLPPWTLPWVVFVKLGADSEGGGFGDGVDDFKGMNKRRKS